MVDEFVVSIDCLLEFFRLEFTFLKTLVWLYVHDLFDLAILPLRVEEKVHNLAFKQFFVIDLLFSQRGDLMNFNERFIKLAFLNAQFFIQ
jgi:hypothetical protein